MADVGKRSCSLRRESQPPATPRIRSSREGKREGRSPRRGQTLRPRRRCAGRLACALDPRTGAVRSTYQSMAAATGEVTWRAARSSSTAWTKRSTVGRTVPSLRSSARPVTGSKKPTSFKQSPAKGTTRPDRRTSILGCRWECGSTILQVQLEPPKSTVLMRTPIRSLASNTRQSTSAWLKALAAVRPAIPAPTTITRSTDRSLELTAIRPARCCGSGGSGSPGRSVV